jgi:hypothetical protein
MSKCSTRIPQAGVTSVVSIMTKQPFTALVSPVSIKKKIKKIKINNN